MQNKTLLFSPKITCVLNGQYFQGKKLKLQYLGKFPALGCRCYEGRSRIHVRFPRSSRIQRFYNIYKYIIMIYIYISLQLSFPVLVNNYPTEDIGSILLSGFQPSAWEPPT